MDLFTWTLASGTSMRSRKIDVVADAVVPCEQTFMFCSFPGKTDSVLNLFVELAVKSSKSLKDFG